MQNLHVKNLTIYNKKEEVGRPKGDYKLTLLYFASTSVFSNDFL